MVGSREELQSVERDVDESQPETDKLENVFTVLATL